MTDALGVPQLSPWEKPRSSGGIRAFPKVTAEAPSASATPSQPGLQAGSKQTLSGLLVFSVLQTHGLGGARDLARPPGGAQTAAPGSLSFRSGAGCRHHCIFRPARRRQGKWCVETQGRLAGLSSRRGLPEATAAYAAGPRLPMRMGRGWWGFVLASFWNGL